MSDPRPISVAVVGVGHLGRHHLRLAATLPGWRCVGAYDPDRARLDALCGEFGATPLDSIERAVELAEAAVIAAPTVNHAEIAERFLGAGRHLLVEKPIAVSVAEGERMVALAARHGAVLGVGHVEFFNPAVQAVIARSPRPRYLDAQRLSPFTRRSLDIDVVLDLMVHDLHLAQALNAGSPLGEVRAVGVPVLSPRVDLANVRLEFANGCVATLTSSRVSAERVRKLRLFEPDCYYSIDYTEQAVSAYRLERDGAEPRIEPVVVEVTRDEPLAVEHRAFQRACRGLPGPFVTGEAGTAALAAAVAVVEAIEAAGTNRRPS
jgi:predicted dehydrogenase